MSGVCLTDEGVLEVTVLVVPVVVISDVEIHAVLVVPVVAWFTGLPV